MKTFKRFSAILLAVLMLVAMMAVPTSAVPTDGQLTITNTAAPVTYNLYKILNLESYGTDGTYSYTLTGDDWDNFITSGAGSNYLAVTSGTNYVVAKAAYIHDAQAALLAKAAIKYAADYTIAPTASGTVAAGQNTITFSALTHGYYVIESSRGTALMVNTATTAGINISDKNNLPSIVKEVQENSDLSWGIYNDAAIGETVNYRITVTAANDAKNYVIHDNMAVGLSYNASSLAVKFFDHSAGTTTTMDSADYTITTPGDGCAFEVAIKQSFLEKVSINDQFILEYNATLDSDAGVGTGAGGAVDKNKNTAKLKFGGVGSGGSLTNQEERSCNDTVTYTYDMTITKTKSGGGTLAGAQFLVKNTADKYLKMVDNKLTWETDKVNATTFVSDANGKIDIKGMDAGTYCLHEEKAPDGYNVLSGDITFILTGNHTSQALTLELSGPGAKNPNRSYAAGTASFDVENVFGTVLPTTGGIGTTVFYGIGGVLVLAALALLSVRKRTAAK